MAPLLALFILVPVAEFYLLLNIGSRIGLPATVLLVVTTGAIGAYLARRQGLGVLAQLRSRDGTSLGLEPLLDGVIILLAGAVLITPGVLTDALGFFCLVPAGRRVIKKLLKRRFEGQMRPGGGFVQVDIDPVGGAGREPMRDVTPRDSD